MVLEGLFITFLIGNILQIIFYSLSILKIQYHKSEEPILDIDDKPVSIVVCAHNELENLKNLLPKLYAQAYANFEIIVVDDRSTDGSYEFLLGESDIRKMLKLVRIDFSPDHISAKKYALTLGIKAASNEILLMTDADCEPVSNYWIQVMLKQHTPSTDFLLGFSYYKQKKGPLNLFIRHETIQTAIQYFTMAKLGLPYMGVGRNLGYRKSLFLSKKGFNDLRKIVGGDDDLIVNRYANRKNTSVVIDPDGVILSVPKTNFKAYRIQKKRHLAAGKKYKIRDKFILSVLALSKFSSWIAFIALLLIPYRLYIVTCLFSVQLLLILWSFITFTKKTGVKYQMGWVWLMDFVYISYLISFSFTAFSARNIKWN